MRFLRSVKAVSYTHLDVYKRQENGTNKNCYWLQEYFIASPVTLDSSTLFASVRPSGLVFKYYVTALVAVTQYQSNTYNAIQ